LITTRNRGYARDAKHLILSSLLLNLGFLDLLFNLLLLTILIFIIQLLRTSRALLSP
jgi:hypothetical protein